MPAPPAKGVGDDEASIFDDMAKDELDELRGSLDLDDLDEIDGLDLDVDEDDVEAAEEEDQPRTGSLIEDTEETEESDDNQEPDGPSRPPEVKAGATTAGVSPPRPAGQIPVSVPTPATSLPSHPVAPPAPSGQNLLPASPSAAPMPVVTAPAAPPTAGSKPYEAAEPARPPRIESDKEEFAAWQLPPFNVLATAVRKTMSDEELRRRAETIEQTLSSFGAPARVVEVNQGPVITQFGVEPDYIDARAGKKIKVKVGKISALADDIALSLAAPTIRIEAPVPGKGYVGIEVPNAEPSLVSLRDVMDSPEFRNLDSPLKLALGQNVSGQPIAADLTGMPHLLIAGTTGSGKSVCVNGIICTMLMTNTPDDLKMIMVDPKRVELTNYNGIPHLMAPVVTDLERIVGVLKWVQREMDDRYRKFAMAGARNITDFNNRIERGQIKDERLPFIMVIVDELADLMMLAPDETERVITRLAQMARATGIHIIISTQRPSVDVVTGLIKANFPARIAFAVATSVDSRVILDMPGAEKLLGRGDMLFQAPDEPMPIRMQGIYVSDEEIQRIVDFWRAQASKRPAAEPINIMSASVDRRPGTSDAFTPPPVQQPLFVASTTATRRSDGESDEVDDLFDEAVALVREMGKASISLLQRHLRIGYTRAARLIDIMEEREVIGPHEGGSKPREVLGPDGEPIAPVDDEEDI